MANKMKENERKEMARNEVVGALNLEGFTQVDTGSFVTETELGFVEVRVVVKNKEFDLAEAVENFEFKLAEKAKREAEAEAKKAEKLAKAEAKAKAKTE